MALATDFENAVKASSSISERPSNEDLLKIYSLYKQATEGDCTGDAAVHTHARATSVGLAVIRDVELGSLKRLLPRQRVEEEKHEWR